MKEDATEYCHACEEKRIHTQEEWKKAHPYKGHGYSPETGWTHPDLGPKK